MTKYVLVGLLAVIGLMCVPVDVESACGGGSGRRAMRQGGRSARVAMRMERRAMRGMAGW